MFSIFLVQSTSPLSPFPLFVHSCTISLSCIRRILIFDPPHSSCLFLFVPADPLLFVCLCVRYAFSAQPTNQENHDFKQTLLKYKFREVQKSSLSHNLHDDSQQHHKLWQLIKNDFSVSVFTLYVKAFRTTGNFATFLKPSCYVDFIFWGGFNSSKQFIFLKKSLLFITCLCEV